MSAAGYAARKIDNSPVESPLPQNWNDQPDLGLGKRSGGFGRATEQSRGQSSRTGAAVAPQLDNGSLRDITGSPVKNEPSTVVNVPTLFKPKKVRGKQLNTLQEWEGLVVSLEQGGFTARLRDLTNRGNVEELASIPYEELDPSDRENISIGSVFHLIVGYSRRGGSQRRETIIYFRRYYTKAKANASRVLGLLKATRGDVD